jgi:two-component system, NarL family, invasion response regulator UvrY
MADDHPLVREGVKEVLRNQKLEVKVTGEASNAEELYSLLEKTPVDIVVLDINMPGPSGLEALKVLREKHAEIPVLILSMHPAERYAVQCLQAGAAGYLTKRSIPDELEKAIDTVVNQKRKYISPDVAENLAEQVTDKSKEPAYQKLSDREYQVMCMIAQGNQIRGIAEELGISVRTVHTYRNRMLSKLKLTTNVEVTLYAIKHQLVE